MARSMALWIAVMDGEHARFVQPDRSHELRTVLALDSTMAHQRSHDIGSDRPGRSFESASSARHAVGGRHDPHVMEKEKFARLVAERLNAASAAEEFDELVIVAPAHTLHEVREELDVGAAAKLVGTLEKDLVKMPDHALSPHVRKWVRPVHRASA